LLEIRKFRERDAKSGTRSAATPSRRRGVASLLAREVDRAKETKHLRHINRIRASFADRSGQGIGSRTSGSATRSNGKMKLILTLFIASNI